MNGKRIIVTGGAGFIGSNLVRFLADENDVVVVDDLSTGELGNIRDLVDDQSVVFINGSITDLDLLQDTFKDIDYVFHQAAIPSVPRSVKDPIKSNFANVNGTLNVLVAARDNKVKKVVYASSSSVYGDSPVLPKVEDMKPSPLSPYAVSKIVGEYYCQVFSDVYGLSTVSLRYFNVFGPRQDPLSEYAAVIPKFITMVLNEESPVVFGDGEQTRDFTFVRDAVDANILAMESEACGVYNIAGGKRVSINELAKLVMKIIGKNLDVVYEKPRPGDILHSLADVTKAKQEFGFEQKYDLTRGLEETIRWFQK